MNPRERLPHSLRALASLDWHPVTTGESKAYVWRIATGDSWLFLKAEPTHVYQETSDEVLRLDYLAEMGFPAPRVLDHVLADQFNWLLMTAVPGHDLTHYVDRPTLLCRILADGLKRLHALDSANCPFKHNLDNRLAAAEANLIAGRVEETDFDSEHMGWNGQRVFDWLAKNRPTELDPIVAHGDAYMPNLLANDDRFSGVVDCARLGVADRWQDLALACRSLEANGGKDLVNDFLAAYGAEFDARKYAYYCTLDELF